MGIIEAQTRAPDPATTFDACITAVFGEGIAEHFMRPYNFKVWAHPARDDGHQLAGRPGARRRRRAASSEPPRRPRRRRAGGRTTSSSSRCSAPACSTSASPSRCRSRSSSTRTWRRVDIDSKVVTFSDGTSTNYDLLINTMPLTELVKMIPRLPGRGPRRDSAVCTTPRACSSASASPSPARAPSAGCTSPKPTRPSIASPTCRTTRRR